MVIEKVGGGEEDVWDWELKPNPHPQTPRSRITRNPAHPHTLGLILPTTSQQYTPPPFETPPSYSPFGESALLPHQKTPENQV